MILSSVEYEFFDFEEPSHNATELHRQIRLRFADGRDLFVSWTWERQPGPGSQPYSVGYKESSSDTGGAVGRCNHILEFPRHRYHPNLEHDADGLSFGPRHYGTPEPDAALRHPGTAERRNLRRQVLTAGTISNTRIREPAAA